MEPDLNYLERAMLVEKELTKEADAHPDLWPSAPASTYILMLAAISQAASLEKIAASLEKLERLADLVQDVYDIGPAIQVRTSVSGSR